MPRSTGSMVPKEMPPLKLVVVVFPLCCEDALVVAVAVEVF